MNRHAINTSVIATLTFAALGSGCLEHPVKPVEIEVSGVESGPIEVELDRRVDVLVVVDNSGSMGEEQANLSQNFGALVERLEEVGAEYRIAVTTTDNGNPWCAGTGPEAGNFVSSSCETRLGQFTSLDGETNVEDSACESICEFDAGDIEIQPSYVEGDGLEVRPWIESQNGVTNLPEGIAPADAFSCYGPQGIDGCGFESPLESMYKSLLRSADQSEDEYGFFREGAMLAILFVTDEADCSYQVDWQDMFEADPNNPFLEDPDSFPTSAVCWNAGVTCEGAGGVYEYCEAADFDIDGNPTDDPSAAVLHPVDRYVEFVRAFGAQTDREVVVGVISGVPEAYEEGNTEIGYADAQDAGFQTDFGIGPGCTSVIDGATQTAVPPVRLREFAEAFPPEEGENLYSVCSDDYRPALDQVADHLIETFEPECANRCIRDEDPSTPELEPFCTFEESHPDGSENDVPMCELGFDEAIIPEGADVCWFVRTDPDGLTDEPIDDMHEECVKEGNNAQFEIVRRPGVPVEPGTRIMADCVLAEFASVSCPAP